MAPSANTISRPRPVEIRVTDGNGDATFYTSTALGLLQTVADAAGNTVTYAYDSVGNRIRAINGAGETVSFNYDPRNNLTAIIDGANNRWSATYDAGATRITDPNKNVWTLSYDAVGNLAGVTDPLSAAVAATRNDAGQIVSLADPKGNTRTYQYNADGLPTGFTDALGNKWAYDYDGAARPVSRTDPAGVTVKTAYTNGNRIAGLTAADTQQPFDYSGIQRDSLNRISRYTDSNGNQLSYTYDAAGQLTAITLPGGKTVAYQYDHLHRLSKVTDWQGNFAVYRYDVAGWPVSLSVSGGPVTIYQYDTARNLRAIVSTGPDGAPVAGYRYTVDSNGNRTAVSALEPNTSSPLKPGSLTYIFDAAGRPVSRSDGATYKYDALGNLSAIEGSTQYQVRLRFLRPPAMPLPETARGPTATIPPACSPSATIAAWSTISPASARASSWKPPPMAHPSHGTSTASDCSGRSPPMALRTSTTSMETATPWRSRIHRRAWSIPTATMHWGG